MSTAGQRLRAAPTVDVDSSRASQVRAGVRVEMVTVAWMVVEAVVAIGAGVLAASVLLTAFGIDSVIELVTGGALLWRLATEARGGDLARVARGEPRRVGDGHRPGRPLSLRGGQRRVRPADA